MIRGVLARGAMGNPSAEPRLRPILACFVMIRGIVHELTDRSIAHQLGKTYNTLRTQLGRLYRELPGGGVQTRIGVVRRVFETYVEIQQVEAENTEQQHAANEGLRAPNRDELPSSVAASVLR